MIQWITRPQEKGSGSRSDPPSAGYWRSRWHTDGTPLAGRHRLNQCRFNVADCAEDGWIYRVMRMKKHRRTPFEGCDGVDLRDPAMTDFRARGTIMGLTGLTAVFGMGTGGAPSVSSPECGRGAVRPHGRGQSGWSGHDSACVLRGRRGASGAEGGGCLEDSSTNVDLSRMRFDRVCDADEIHQGRAGQKLCSPVRATGPALVLG